MKATDCFTFIQNSRIDKELSHMVINGILKLVTNYNRFLFRKENYQDNLF